MTAPGTRVSRTNHQHLAVIREARDHLDRNSPDWLPRLRDRLRPTPSRRVAPATNLGE